MRWFKLYDELRSKIKSGLLRAETELDKNLVAPHADESDFQRVIERLADEGLLQRNDHDALTVAKPRARSRRSASFFEDYSDQGRSPAARTLSLEIVPLEDSPAFVQDALAQTDYSMLIRHHHVQCVDDIPHAIADSYIPYDLIRSEWKNIKDGESDLHKTLSDLGYAVTAKQETLYVDWPSADERLHLDIAAMPGLPVVRLDCIVWAQEAIVEVCLLCDRSDLYEFTYRVQI